ncbi:glutathione S-transferase 1-like [Branchiostoma lanceolatum]|uniref:GSTT2B protein n=1 Tax=Branchiostoma lanceolatum TaxID=7740 RepID=A0A8K0EAP1_BRALA|nr:GSTT2B [Branchiostoma lanceolatum]
MPVTLYHNIVSAPCRAVMMCAKTIGLDLEEKPVDLLAGEQMKPEFLAMNPCHCVPTIDDDGFIMWESRAINIYLNDKYSSTPEKLYPKDPKKRARINMMLQYDLTTYTPAIVGYVAPILFAKKEPDDETKKKLADQLEIFNNMLEGKNFVAGNELSLADFSLGGATGMMAIVGYDVSGYKNIVAWRDRMVALPGVKDIQERMMEAVAARNESS